MACSSRPVQHVARLVVQALLDENQVVIEVQADDVAVEIAWVEIAAGHLAMVKPVDQALEERHAGGRRVMRWRAAKFGPIRRLSVLHRVDAVCREQWKKDLEAMDDVTVHVAAVVNHDVERSDLTAHA